MLEVLATIVLSVAGTVGVVNLSDEAYRTINTFLNLLTVIGGPLVIYWVTSKTRKALEPKVDKVVERTEHLEEWDGSDRRGDA